MASLAEDTADEKRGETPAAPPELPPPPPSEVKKPVRRRPPRPRRRRKKTARERFAGWLATRFTRLGAVLVMPHKAFRQIVDDPDYFGAAFITIAVILMTVGANYVLWETKILFYDVDLLKNLSLPFPYPSYLMSETFAFAIFQLGRNFAIYYVLTWVLGGRRDAGLLFACTGYTLASHIIGRLAQLFVSYSILTPVTYQVSTETSIILLTGSLQQLMLHQERWASTVQYNHEVMTAWQASVPMVSFQYVTQGIGVWTALVAFFAIREATGLSWKKSSAVAAAPLILDIAFFVYSLL